MCITLRNEKAASIGKNGRRRHFIHHSREFSRQSAYREASRRSITRATPDVAELTRNRNTGRACHYNVLDKAVEPPAHLLSDEWKAFIAVGQFAAHAMVRHSTQE
jgi:hypothetical protein